MNEIIYAKSNPPETLSQHIETCLCVYEDLRRRCPALLCDLDWDILYYAVKYHDLGKLDIPFQNQIRRAMKLPPLDSSTSGFPHGYLSLALLDRKFFLTRWKSKSAFHLLAMMIFYHHNRPLMTEEDCMEYDRYVQSAFTERCRALGILPKDGQSDRGMRQRAYANLRGEAEEESFQLRYILLKGLLNRIDYCASAGRKTADEPLVGPDISACTRTAMENSGYTLRPVQDYLASHAGENLIIEASTGIGKTEGALLWLGGRKGFYTLPLKVSIHAIYTRICDEKGIAFPHAALLHGDARAYYLSQDSEASDLRWQATRLFACPLTVCTVDQIMRFVYKANGTEIAAAVLAGSYLILDEIQMYSPELLAAILYALHVITSLGGHFLILTATFPKLLLRFLERESIPIAAAPQTFHADLPARHRIQLCAERSFPAEQIIEQGKTRKVLVICNTIAQAQKLYQTLSSAAQSVYLLHSRYIRRHRSLLESAILRFAPNQKTRNAHSGIWISTQIVEASLDLDFDVLYTSLCTVDSLLQRMGRIYRSRPYDLGEQPNVFIVDNGDGCGTVIEETLYAFSLAAVRNFNGCLLEESDEQDDKSRMMDLVYDPVKNPDILKSPYYQRVSDRLNTFKNLRLYDTDNANFREIDSITVVPESIYTTLEESGKLNELTQALASGNMQEVFEARQELLQYTTSVRQGTCPTPESQQLFWKHSRIWRCPGSYDFDETTLSGVGFQPRKRSTNHRLIDQAQML